MPRRVFPLGPDVEHDNVAARQPLPELGCGEMLDPVPPAEVLVCEHADLGQMTNGDLADRRPELGDLIAREPVDHPRSLAARTHEPCAREDLQVLRRVRDRLRDLIGDLLDRPLALREHVDDLRAPPAAERLRNRRQAVEQGRLRLATCHGSTSYQANT